jgi:predicted nucleotidyltransferase
MDKPRPIPRPDQLLDQITSQIVAHFDPQRLILFGSYARGDAREGSDLDLLIVAPSDEPRWRRAVPVYRLLVGLGVPKEIVWWTPDEIAEWRDVRSHFIYRALREGKVLYEKSA